MKKTFYALSEEVAQFKENIMDYDASEIQLFSTLHDFNVGQSVVKIEVNFVSEGTIEEVKKFAPLEY